MYRGKQEADRYFPTRGLYEPPDHKTYNKQLIDDGDVPVDPADEAMERQFGVTEAQEARNLERQLFTQALKKQQNQKG
jgi:hypothetical protein